MSCSSGKRVFVTRKQARKEARKKSKKHKITLRSYKCYECGYFHLTSKCMNYRIKVKENRGKTHD